MLHCPECGVNLADGLLTAHSQKQHRVRRGEANPTPHQGGGGGRGEGRVREGTPVKCRVSFPTILAWLRCPVQGYRGKMSSR